VRVFLALIGWAAACFSAAAQPFLSGADHEARLAAELVVMAGDVRRLTTEKPGPLERQGLEKRIAGALSSLPLLMRRAGGAPESAVLLRHQLQQRDWQAMAHHLSSLKQRHPFDARRLTEVKPTPSLMAQGASIHKTSCAACHDHPGKADTLLPAKNLSTQLHSMSRQEFAARLLLGVRGDKSTLLANPFSEPELAALIAGYSRPD
jgi:hypothetical protein